MLSSMPLLAKTYRAVITNITQETEDVCICRLELPGKASLEYLPGHFMTLSVQTPEGKVTRAYSLSSSPTEKGNIGLTIKIEPHGKMTGYLKQNAKPGMVLELKGPQGLFTYDESMGHNLVLIGGGSGVAPFRSIITYFIDKGVQGSVTNIWSFRTPREIIYAKELEVWARHAGFKNVITITRPQGFENEWKWTTGRIDADMVKSNVANLAGSKYYLCGPPPMMGAMQEALASLGVGKDSIKVEKYG